MPASWSEGCEESEAKRPRVADVLKTVRECRRSIQSAGGLCWSSADLAIAATLLETPNARFPTVSFANLEEKRRVFTLVYDVLRYKSILNQALNDLYFFTRYPYLKERCHLVWLLFFDLYKRDFTMRDALEPEVEAAFSRQGMHEVDAVLWGLRVKLAATVSRLRIKSGAHSLCQLLPHHLTRTRSALEENIITGWVNVFKTSMRDTSDILEEMGIRALSRNKDDLEPLTFKTDHLLPRFLHIMPNLRDDLVSSAVIRDHHIIMQERTFCLGPAVMAQLLKDYALSGKVAQTHVNSPITTAYFANLLINNDKIEALLVFGAGYRKEACEQYLQELGVKNTQVFSESFAGLSPDNRVLDNVIAVLATPPNTNSSVVDPVDLAVARGGDLQILQQLTDDDFAATPSGDHINRLLVDQRDTVRRALSKPQIQFVLYETHSRFTCENEEMTSNLISELNNYAREVHLEELRRSQGESQERERSQAESQPVEMEISESQIEGPTIRLEAEELSLPMPTSSQSITIPPSDLFELGDLPDLCPNSENCLELLSEGTYIALIKRKEIIRLDPKYMIQMAEARGLFGRPEGTPKTKGSGQTARAKAALAALQARSEASADRNKGKVKVEMDRIAAPTRSSLLRDVRPPATKDCPRFAHHLAHDGTTSYLIGADQDRKTYLSIFEEEELIRRLYTCPKVPVFPPRLYEDLPSLKFWNSPASVIEEYLKCKVFQRRLQLAYEFNQQKDSGLIIAEGVLQATQNQLTQAMVQLTSDMNYFQHVSSNQVLKQAQQRDSELTQSTHEYQNKLMWDYICPEEIETHQSEQEYPKTVERAVTVESRPSKLIGEIKKRYIDYKNFYKLQHLKKEIIIEPSKSIPATAKPQTPTLGPVVSVVSFFETSDSKDIANSKIKKVVMKCNSDQTLFRTISARNDSVVSSNRLPKVQYSSLHSVYNVTDMKPNSQFFSANETEEPKYLQPQSSVMSVLQENVSRRGTVLTARDSITLAQKRISGVGNKANLSKLNKLKISRVSLASHKDSFSVLLGKRFEKNKPGVLPFSRDSFDSLKTKSYTSDNISYAGRHASTLIGHQDSFTLTTGRFNSKSSKFSETVTCDICNNIYKPIQFTCSFHAKMFDDKTVGNHSIISTKRPFLSHKDSIDLLQDKITSKEKKTSVAIQAGDSEMIAETTHDNSRFQSAKYVDNEKTQYKNSEQLAPDTNHVNMTVSSLNNYLMKSLSINICHGQSMGLTNT